MLFRTSGTFLYHIIDSLFEFSLAQIYQELYDSIEKFNPKHELKWWSRNRGIDMEMIEPKFIVCSKLFIQYCNLIKNT